MAKTEIEIKIRDVASWKLKVLQTVIKFLNWVSIMDSPRNSGDVVITVHIDIATVCTNNEQSK